MTTNLTLPFNMTILKPKIAFYMRFSHQENEIPVYVASLVERKGRRERLVRRWRTASPKKKTEGIPWEVVTREQLVALARDFMHPDPKPEEIKLTN